MCVSGLNEYTELDSFSCKNGQTRLHEKDRREKDQVQRHVAETFKEMEKSFHEGKVSNYYYHDLWGPAGLSGNYHYSYNYYY